jgi:hypothetical protein
MYDEILPLLHQLAEAGIWLQRKPDGTVIVGPTHLVSKHRKLVEQVRPHKQAISRLIESQLAHALFGEKEDDPRFETDTCPECSQQVYVMAPTDGENMSSRFLAVHRLPDGKTVCRGGGIAATIDVSMVLGAFLADRCIKSPRALLTWTSLWAAFQAWCLGHRILPIPAPDTVREAMRQYGESVNNSWTGWVLRLEEWRGDQEVSTLQDKNTKTAKIPQADAHQQPVLFTG